MAELEAAPIDAGDPALDPRAFRRSLGQYPTGVTVVTTRSGDELAGVTANSFASVSMDPPLVLWSLQNTSTSYQTFTSATHFAINILASDQIEFSQRFAKSGPEKFRGLDLAAGAGGAPILPGIAAALECRREFEREAGDHLIMVGCVEKYSRYDRPSLVFDKGRYASTIDHPTNWIERQVPHSEMSIHRFFIVLLNRAYNRMRNAMAGARETVHLDLNESRVLSAASAYPARSLEVLIPITFLDRNAAEDALINLVNKEYARVGPGGTIEVTKTGSDVLEDLFSRTLSVEKQILSSVSEGDLKITEKALKTIIGSDAFSR